VITKTMGIMQSPKVIISGGGTGGHIFPAVAIANALKKINPNTEILFVGAKGRMEMEKVPKAGYKIIGLWISGIHRRITFKNILFPFKLILSLLKSGMIIRRFKPDVVVGTGGFASGPLLYRAAGKGVPTLIQEQNSYPGITNKLLGKRVDKICVAYDDMDRFFPKEKIMLTGNPVRQDILNLEGKRARGLEMFGLSGNKRILLVVGGSLGALTVNESIHNGIERLLDNNIQLVWQTGESYIDKGRKIVNDLGCQNVVYVSDFIHDMDYAYSIADLVISRAGAIAISELCVLEKPIILVPSPNVAEDHQTKNAMALVNHQAACLVKDVEARDQLIDRVLELIFNDDELQRYVKNISGLAHKDSAKVIASEVLRLAEK